MRARLTFDARGEFDLRPAITSHISLVRDKAEHDYNPGGQMQPDYSDLVLDCPMNAVLFEDTRGHFQVSRVLFSIRSSVRLLNGFVVFCFRVLLGPYKPHGSATCGIVYFAFVSVCLVIQVVILHIRAPAI